MQNSPAIKICMPTHNSAESLKETMDSILSQNYPNFRIIVTDNNSTDNTEKIVRSFKDCRLFFRKNTLSRDFGRDTVGALESCNNCFLSNLADGEFVAFYHSDDIYEKDMVKKEVEFLQTNPHAGAVFTSGKTIDERGQIIGRFKLPKELRGKNIYNFYDIFMALMKNGNIFLQTPTFMTRKKTFADVGMFSENFGTSSDLEMWLKIAEKYPIGILQDDLIRRRVGGASKRYNSLRTERAEFFRIMDYYLYEKRYVFEVDTKCLRQYEYQKDFDNTLIAMNFLIKGDEKEAKKIVNSSFKWKFFRAFFENMSILRTKILILKIILFAGINVGLGKPLGKILDKIL